MSSLRALPPPDDAEEPETARLDRVFSALSDPVRRQILERLDGRSLLVSELAAPFAISLQAVSRHIQVLVRAGLVRQERTVYTAAVWINRYAKYWQEQFDLLAATLFEIEERRPGEKRPTTPRGRRKRAPRRRI